MKTNDLSVPLRNIDVALARAFVATAETGGMTAAGRLLNLTQGAVSQQIKRLEDLLQKELFDREHRQLTLTAEGERLLLHARRLIALNDEIWGLMSAPGFEGTVRLGVPGDIIRPFLPPILRAFKNAWPKVKIELNCESSVALKKALSAGDIDLTLTTESDTPQGAERLLTEDLVWLGCPGGRIWHEDPLPVGNANPSCTFRAAMLHGLEKQGRDWRIVGPSGHEVMLAKIEADLAVTALLQSSVPPHLEILGPDSGLPALTPFHVNLYVRTSQTNEVVQELAQQIRDQVTRRFAAPERKAG
ncbi:MAG: LysR family transcriptional regulator [Rhodospirillales bacterium]|nr:LysR family transcriptional regulator [Rhodospirillales bacterium]MBO6787312.1 LysR family transcriptional regulator [Rhodospirillales bacterium]